MSQQGADDWWQKLYEDPDAGPEPDPGDTLDNRFRSASVLVTDPDPGAQPGPGPVPGMRAERDPAPPGPVPVAPPGARPGPPDALLPGPRRPGPPAPSPEVPPHEGSLPPSAPPPPAAPPPPPQAAVPPLPPPAGVGGAAPASAPHQGAVPPVPPQPAVPPPAAQNRAGAVPQGVLPPPRDPREGGVTGYALGGVDVPPVPPAQPPARRWEVPREDTPREPVPPPPAPPASAPAAPARARPEVQHLGDRAPTYAAEPGALPPADPADLHALTPDTVLEGARYGSYSLRAASLRGDSARFRGEARRDFLLTARFGGGDEALVLVVLAGGDRAAPGAAEAAAELCRTVAGAVGRSQERLSEDIRAGRRDALRSGLQRLTDRGYGRLRARAAELGLAEDAYTAGLRGLLLPVDAQCRTRISFGAGAGGLFRLRAGRWQDLEPAQEPSGEPSEPSGPSGADFRFRASVAEPGDTLLLCSGGLAEPMREEASLPEELAARWSEPEPPGLAAFLADTQLRLKGYADDRTAAAVWEA
ncbi:protein phosphatase 2C domain-containing protein [Streptomyces xanthophaeus]|uniref:protein phosphatase 2C domain-containing protein n=1 Tax=Streptomyces xanthophaeus TaxID=67385 RepID=UPI00364AC585